MASSAHQPFGSRSYGGGKLPDRSVNANAIPFSASSFSRHRGLGATGPGEFGAEGAKSTQQAPPQPPVHSQTHGPSQDSNPLNRLTEEQREEINEAVSDLILRSSLCLCLCLCLCQVTAAVFQPNQRQYGYGNGFLWILANVIWLCSLRSSISTETGI